MLPQRQRVRRKEQDTLTCFGNRRHLNRHSATQKKPSKPTGNGRSGFGPDTTEIGKGSISLDRGLTTLEAGSANEFSIALYSAQDFRKYILKGAPRTNRDRTGETRGASNSQNREMKCACIVEAHESSRKRTNEPQHGDHEGHIAQSGFTSLSHCNLVHKPIPMHEVMKNSGCESRS